MANARKVIMRTKVSLLDAVGTLEEETHDDYIASSSIGSVSTNGRWGGNSVNTDISSSQTGNWSSFVESENIDWNLNAQNWEEAGAWTGDFGLTTSGVALSTDTADLKFLYIKNTGSNTVEISLDEGSSYPIKLSANASTMLRGTSDLDRDEVYVKTSSGTSTVDYILAG
jgi:hypothetical protein